MDLKARIKLVEKRKDARFPVDLPSEFRLEQSDDRWLDSKIVNVSRSGARMEGACVHPKGAVLELRVPVTQKDAESLMAHKKATIMWNDGSACGLKYK